MTAMRRHDWDKHYSEGQAPWDSGVPSKELIRVLAEESIPAGRAAELGCGTGTNAIYLASRGFDVTAFDVSAAGLAAARQKAAAAGAKVNFVEADLCNFQLDVPPFDFIFDRGLPRRSGDRSARLHQDSETPDAARHAVFAACRQRQRERSAGPADGQSLGNLRRAGALVRDSIPP